MRRLVVHEASLVMKQIHIKLLWCYGHLLRIIINSIIKIYLQVDG